MLWPLSKVTLLGRNSLNHSVFLTFEYRKSKLRIHSFQYNLNIIGKMDAQNLSVIEKWFEGKVKQGFFLIFAID